VTTAFPKRFTRARVGAGLSVALIVFGVIDAALPQHRSSFEPATAVPTPQQGARDAGAASSETAAQDVAERFVIATDTTDPAHPEGDVVTQSALAPELKDPHDLSWPVAWSTEDRRTTVVLDPPGAPLAESGGQLVVVLVGVITVTTDSGPPTAVPLAERVTLCLVSDSAASGDAVHGGRGSLRFVVTSLQAGA